MTTLKITKKGGGHPTSQSIYHMQNRDTVLLLQLKSIFYGCSPFYKTGTIWLPICMYIKYPIWSMSYLQSYTQNATTKCHIFLKLLSC